MTPHPSAPGRLRIVYRSHGGENLKGRPPYYSKLLSLASVVRAVEESGVSESGVSPQLIFWNDGPVPGDRLELMRSSGEVVQVEAGSNRASYRAAIEMAARSDWDDRDLVWFAEDDYLYRPEAFRMAYEAFARIPDADYLSVFGGLALDLTAPRTAPRPLPGLGAVNVPDPIRVGDALWFRGLSTTSTFGVRLGVLREDRVLLRTIPYSGGGWDHTTCLALQGLQPFYWEDIGQELLPFRTYGRREWPVAVLRGVIQAGMNLCLRRSQQRRRRLYLCDPLGAVHLELSVDELSSNLPSATDVHLDWTALAADARRWALGRGVRLDPQPTSTAG